MNRFSNPQNNSANLREMISKGNALMNQGKIKEASLIANKLLTSSSHKASVMGFAAMIASARGENSKAEEMIADAIEKEGSNPGFYIMKAQILLRQRKRIHALETLDRAHDIAPDNVQIITACAQHYSKLDQHEKAHEILKRVSEMEPDKAFAWYNYATTARYLGELEECEKAVNKAIKLNPDNIEAYFLRADLRTVTNEDNHIEETEKRLKTPVPEGKPQAQINYALAKEYEDIGAYKKSFEYLNKGAAAQRSTYPYNVEQDEVIMSDIQKYYSADFLSQISEGFKGPTPVFVMGMPRTGTTLLERILSSHSQVTSAGERTEFSMALAQCTQDVVSREEIGKEGLVKATTKMNFRDLGETYHKSMEYYDEGSPLVIDKLPFNFLYVGLILKALPDAKIINVTRTPMDTCYSVYKMLFNQVYPFSYDLEELARYYVAYRGLMEHWQDTVGGGYINVAYEDLVDDTEHETRRILNYLAVDFEQDCLEFQKNKTASTTASATQVRKGIYKSSVEKWRNYEEELKPLYSRLEAAGILSW